MAKTTRSKKELDDLLAERFFALETVKADMRDDPRADPKPPTAYEREHDGVSNWGYRLGTNSGPYSQSVELLAEELRSACDMAQSEGK